MVVAFQYPYWEMNIGGGFTRGGVSLSQYPYWEMIKGGGTFQLPIPGNVYSCWLSQYPYWEMTIRGGVPNARTGKLIFVVALRDSGGTFPVPVLGNDYCGGFLSTGGIFPVPVLGRLSQYRCWEMVVAFQFPYWEMNIHGGFTGGGFHFPNARPGK